MPFKAYIYTHMYMYIRTCMYIYMYMHKTNSEKLIIALVLSMQLFKDFHFTPMYKLCCVYLQSIVISVRLQVKSLILKYGC